MFKKFIQGLVFGSGFGIAFVAIWVVALNYIIPNAIEAKFKVPEFNNPTVAEIVPPGEGKSTTQKEYSFFKHTGRMQIPDGGGILAMSPMQTEPSANRPSTYQLWLTHSELWQIRTIDDKVEVEKLTYPEGASVETLDRLMKENLGVRARQSTMTVSSDEIERIKSGGTSFRDQTLNGKLSLNTEGVVFALPNPYET